MKHAPSPLPSTLSLGCLLCVGALAASALADDSGGKNGAELRSAPEATSNQNAPPEASLSPPPDAEKSQAAGMFVVVENPAFPAPAIEPPPPDRGARLDANDFAPYFASGPAAAARAEFDRGQYGRAFALLQRTEDSVPVRYLRALSALRSENYQVAAEEMTKLSEAYPPLRDRCLTHGGIAEEEQGRNQKAAALFRQVPEGSRLFVDARLGLSRVLRKLGDLSGAIDALAPLQELPAPSWGRDVGAEALLAVADLSQRRKDARGEREALLRLWSEHPLSALSKQAEGRLRGVKISDAHRVGRAERLVEAHRNQVGLSVLEPLLAKLKLPDPVACRAHFTYGKALRKERQHSKAIRALTPVVAQCKDPELRPRAMYVLGSSRSIADSANGAGTYEALAAEYPEHPFADDALYYAADLYLRNGDADSALARLDALGAKYPEGDFLAEALFKAFWVRKGRGELDKAFFALDRIEQVFGGADESYELERARYWRARVLQGKGDLAQALKLFEALAREHPATYYGLLARTRLMELEPGIAERLLADLRTLPKEGQRWPLFAGPLGEQPRFRTAVELLRLGFPEAVSGELLSVSRAGLPRESLRLMVRVLSLANDPRTAHAIARTSLRGDISGRITEQTRAIWEVAYPTAFRPLIEKHCAAAELDPDLLQALMREESALDPQALSWAGALGLTQLMPSTANAVARLLKLPKVSTRALLEPDLNIRLGAAHLGQLVRRFDGNRFYAIASYNAGALAVDRWIRERPNLELDAWVEEIPIAETRGYVKRVLRTFNTYQLLGGKLASPLSAMRP